MTEYHPRKPTDSPSYRLIPNHFDGFEQIYKERFSYDYNFYRTPEEEKKHTSAMCANR